MERLTQRTGSTVVYVGKHAVLPGLDDASTMRVAARREVMRRLCAYEEIGMSPEEIKYLLANQQKN